MLKYDSTHGNFKGSINVIDDSTLEINGKKVNVVSKRYCLKSSKLLSAGQRTCLFTLEPNILLFILPQRSS